MRNLIRIPLALVLALFFFACTADTIQPTETSTDATEALQEKTRQLEVEITEEIAELEAEELISPRSHIVLPAGSVDGLADAIADAGPGGTVVLATGPHVETETVTITHRIRLVGEDGAELIFDDAPIEVSGQVEVGLHFIGANRCLVRNIDFRIAGAVGGTAILLQESDRAFITRNTMEDYQFGVLIEKSNRTFITQNDIAVSDLWQIGETIVQSFGIVNVNGLRTRVYGNQLSGGITGVWACDKGGYIAHNEFFNNLEGIILCKVPAEYNYLLPDGYLLAAEVSCKDWAVFLNDSHDNLDAGYQVIDGANNNFILANSAMNNVRVAYEFAGDTERFGLGVTPSSFNNTTLIFGDDTYVDCGQGNQVFGGTALDNTGENCF